MPFEAIIPDIAQVVAYDSRIAGRFKRITWNHSDLDFCKVLERSVGLRCSAGLSVRQPTPIGERIKCSVGIAANPGMHSALDHDAPSPIELCHHLFYDAPPECKATPAAFCKWNGLDVTLL